MKKLITMCLLIATVFTVNAQVKPTKEETITYLTKTFKLSQGENFYLSGSEEFTYTLCDFSIDKIIINYHLEKIKNEADNINTASNFKWETVTSINSSSQKGNLITVSVVFSSKFKLKDFIQGSKGYEGYQNTYSFYIVKDKADNFKKALERLVEIAKEENKDPFQN